MLVDKISSERSALPLDKPITDNVIDRLTTLHGLTSSNSSLVNDQQFDKIASLAENQVNLIISGKADANPNLLHLANFMFDLTK